VVVGLEVLLPVPQEAWQSKSEKNGPPQLAFVHGPCWQAVLPSPQGIASCSQQFQDCVVEVVLLVLLPVVDVLLDVLLLVVLLLVVVGGAVVVVGGSVVVVVGPVVVVELVVLLVVVLVLVVVGGGVVVVPQAVQITSHVSWPAIVGTVQPHDGS
jgi:hypothetical protein